MSEQNMRADAREAMKLILEDMAADFRECGMDDDPISLKDYCARYWSGLISERDKARRINAQLGKALEATTNALDRIQKAVGEASLAVVKHGAEAVRIEAEK